MNFGKREILITLEIFLKFKIFDQPSPLKHEIWQNQENFIRVDNFAEI